MIDKRKKSPSDESKEKRENYIEVGVNRDTDKDRPDFDDD